MRAMLYPHQYQPWGPYHRPQACSMYTPPTTSPVYRRVRYVPYSHQMMKSLPSSLKLAYYEMFQPCACCEMRLTGELPGALVHERTQHSQVRVQKTRSNPTFFVIFTKHKLLEATLWAIWIRCMHWVQRSQDWPYLTALPFLRHISKRSGNTWKVTHELCQVPSHWVWLEFESCVQGF